MKTNELNLTQETDISHSCAVYIDKNVYRLQS